MYKIKQWLGAIRVPFFTATIVPVVLGSAIAWYNTNNFVWWRFFLAITGAIFIHAGTNLANDYFDHLTGCDEANLTPTPFSGGSRVIQNGLITSKAILWGFCTFFILGGGIGLYLNSLCAGNVILIIGVIGVFLGIFYTAGPLRIGYGSLGEIAVGIGFGPLMVTGAYYVQAQSLPLNVFLASVPIGILIALVLFINEFPDYEGDRSVNKKTLVVILGKKNAVILYHIFLASVYLSVLIFVMAGILPGFCLIVFLSLPLAVKAVIVSKRNFDKIYELLPANAATIGVHLIAGVLITAGFVLAKIF